MAFYDKQLETLGRDGLRDRQEKKIARLMEAVRESETLETVYLGCNLIQEEGAAELTDAISQSSVADG